MLRKLVMPSLSSQVLAGRILAWHKQPGEWVNFGDPLLDVAVEQVQFLDGQVTDRWGWDLQIVSSDVGFLLARLAEAGDSRQVSQPLAWFAMDEEPVDLPDPHSPDAPEFRIVVNRKEE